jgi:sugar (glycoside-pentoside-hexuronide) transporter
LTNEKQFRHIVKVEDRVGVSGKLCYSLGFAGKDTILTVVNNFLMPFLMMVAGLNPAFIGTMMLFARIWDAVNDPILGTLADHTHSKWGKYRPYFIFSSVPMAIIFVALMFVPNFGDARKQVYYTIVYILWGMCFTVVEVPYFGMIPAMSSDPFERASITAWSRIISRIPAIGLPIIVGLLTNVSREQMERNPAGAVAIQQNGYFKVALLCGGIVIVTSVISFFGCKEKAVSMEPAAKKAPGFRSFANILKGNYALLMVMLIQLFFIFNTILCDMLNVNYVMYYLKSPALLGGVIVAAVAFGCIIGQILFPFVLSVVGSGKRIMVVGTLIYVVLLGLNYIAGTISTPMFMAALIVCNAFTGALQICVVNMCFEVCDMVEWKTGERADATIFAVVSFLMKLAAGLAATIAGWGLSLAGFSGGMGPWMGEVTLRMANALAIIRFAIPAGLAFIAFIMAIFYPIGKEQIVKIQKELEEKRYAKTLSKER